MNKLERAINKLLAPTLSESGFKLKATWGGFFRFTDYGFDGFMVIDQGRKEINANGIVCAIKIRHDKIQLPFNKLDFIYGEEEQKQNPTLVLGYPFYKWGTPTEYLMVNSATAEVDVIIVADHLKRVLQQHALPFYERYSNLAEIEELLNHEPMGDIAPYSGGFIYEHRVVTSLLCAKATNPSRYDAVKEAFIKLDKGMYPREKRMEILRKVDAIVIE